MTLNQVLEKFSEEEKEGSAFYIGHIEYIDSILYKLKSISPGMSFESALNLAIQFQRNQILSVIGFTQEDVDLNDSVLNKINETLKKLDETTSYNCPT